MSEYSLLLGDAVQVMRGLPANSVQMVCTSPPYFGLRDYGTATWEGGAAECDHKVGRFERGGLSAKQASNNGSAGDEARGTCPKCGARRIDNQIGLEETPEAYVAKLVEVFREVRRVLHPTGVLFLNLGDSYNGSGGAGGDYSEGGLKEGQPKYPGRNVNGLGPKQLLGIPWRVAFALQADGWILRSEIIWHKRAPMPESVQDRPTKAHEQVFLLAKSPTYFYDHIAIMEPNSSPEQLAHNLRYAKASATYDDRATQTGVPGANNHIGLHARTGGVGRNKRSVWTLGPEQFPGAHFAVMPTKLVEPCILAGTSAHGACAKCGAPWARITERVREHGLSETSFPKTDGLEAQNGHKRLHQRVKAARAAGEPHDNPLGGSVTIGWQPTCTCNADVVPCTVLDPFNGSGTTGAVALKHHRRYIGIDLNADYLELAHRRIQQSQPLLFAMEV